MPSQGSRWVALAEQRLAALAEQWLAAPVRLLPAMWCSSDSLRQASRKVGGETGLRPAS